MPINDNPHAQRLFGSLKNHTDEQTAENIANKINLSKSAGIDKKFIWAKSVCTDLEEQFDDETIKKIRMDCSCGPGMSKIKKIKAIYDKSKDIDDFASKVNDKNFGFTLHAKDSVLYFTYPTCYCSCVNNVNEPISKTWCYCTLGYTKKMFDMVFSCDTDIELIESVKTGGDKCLMKIIW